MRMGTHYRWLRLIIQQALAAMERNPVPRQGNRIWPEGMVLAKLRNMDS
jgi:hypothetical protein